MRELHESGALCAVVVHGIGDFCHDPNDSKEAFALVGELHRLAAKYEAVIIVVLHENPASKGDKTPKMRGHLGSQLERKSETNLRLKKNAEGVTVMFSEKSRHAHIPEASGPCFRWDDEAGMHMACESVRDAKASLEEKELLELFAPPFVADEEGPAVRRYADLVKAVVVAEAVGLATAKRRIKRALELEIIRKTADGYALEQ